MVLLSIALGIILAVIGWFLATKGLRFVRVALPFIVGLLGFLVVLEVLIALDAGTILAYGLAIVSGVLFAFGSYILYKVAIVLQFASFGYLLTFALFGLLDVHVPILAVVIGTFFAIAIAAFAIMFNIWNFLIIVGTALNGAAITVLGIMTMFLGWEAMDFIIHNEFVEIDLDGWVALLLLVVFGGLAIFGMKSQVDNEGGVEGVKDFQLSFFRFDSVMPPADES